MPYITDWSKVPVLIDVPYAMVLLGMSRPTVSRLCQNGDLPAVKIGEQWRIDRDKLKKYIEGEGDYGR